ncbi:SAM-dependent DNA methyltransferase, partial [Candidatus Gottesmanbacteria bacterium]|nr:SAM-dependent DNA methyltransferase [Candidatus Gottesmanbacteria bacterium]
ERIERLKESSKFQALAMSKKRKDAAKAAKEIAAGRKQQVDILAALKTLSAKRLYKNRDVFDADVKEAFKGIVPKVDTPLRKAFVIVLSERDPEADVCIDSKGDPEPDPELRDTESVALPADIPMPLPIGYKSENDKKDPDNAALVELVRVHCDAYFEAEVKPHWPDAWVDFSKARVGYEIPINRHFYVYEQPRPLKHIERDIKKLEGQILSMLKEVIN